MVLWLLGFIIFGRAAAVPRIVFPINSQVPPVARTSKAFQWQFAESTFSGDGPDLRYTVSGSPGWLQLNSSTRSLFGTPQPEDSGPVSFNLVATDGSGSTAMPVTLIVSTDPGPALGKPVADKLSTYGTLSGPDSLVLSHSSPIALTFSPDTFTNTDGNTVYYALCANNTPLPSWLNFNSNTLSFSGTTPQSTSSVELSQSYDIHLTASDVIGFSSAVASFQLIVESHVFTFGRGSRTVEITPGVMVNFSGLQDTLTLDSNPMKAADLSTIVADTPPWMSLNTGNLVLSGTPPSDVSPVNFTVTATDIHGDQAEIEICLTIANDSSSPLFLKTIQPTNATIGSDFEYSLADDFSPDPTLQITVALDKAPWLSFDSKERSIKGQVPSNLRPEQISINITVSEKARSQSQVLELNLESALDGTGSRTTKLPSSATDSASASNSNAADTGDKDDGSQSLSRHTRAQVVVAVLVPLLFIAGLLILICWWRRRRRKRQSSGRSPFILSKDDISRPQLILAEKAGVKYRVEPIRDLESGSERYKRQSSKAPKLADLRRFSNRWSGLGSAYHSAAAFTDLDQQPQYQLAPEDHERLSQNDKASSRKRRSSIIPGEPGKLGHSVSKRYSRRRGDGSGMSISSSNAPFSRSLSGFGHGRNGFSCSSIGRGRGIGVGHGNGGLYHFPEVRRSWRNPTSMKSGSSDCWTSTEGGSERSDFNFPRPPTSDTFGVIGKPYTIHEASDDTADYREKPTIRPVIPSSEDYWPERKAYLEKRAKSRHGDNALFSAKDTRASSQILSGRPLRKSILAPTQPSSKLEPPGTPKQPSSDQENPPQKLSSSYSRSSSLSPPLKPSPSKSITPHRSRRSHLFRHFPVRAISPLRPLRSNASLNSRFRDAESDDVEADLELRLEVDENGEKKWRHVYRPDPLRSNSVRESILSQTMGTGDGEKSPLADVDEDFDIGALLNAAEGSRALRLNALRGRDAGVEGEGVERVRRRPHLGSQRAKRPVSVSNDGGLRPGGPSMRGDLGDAGAFL